MDDDIKTPFLPTIFDGAAAAAMPGEEAASPTLSDEQKLSEGHLSQYCQEIDEEYEKTHFREFNDAKYDREFVPQNNHEALPPTTTTVTPQSSYQEEDDDDEGAGTTATTTAAAAATANGTHGVPAAVESGGGGGGGGGDMESVPWTQRAPPPAHWQPRRLPRLEGWHVSCHACYAQQAPPVR